MPIQLPNIPALSSKVDTEVRRAFDSLKGWLNKIGADGGMLTQGSLVDGLASVPTISSLFDSTIPPQLQNFAATGGFSKIMLTWDDPRYRNFAYVEIYRNTVDDLGTAVKIGSTISTMYPDTPPNSSAAVTYYYWGRIISGSNIQGPFNATAGTPAHTATDPTYALEVLINALTTSQLHIDLNSRINLIDADNVGIVAVLDKLGTALAGLTAADSDRWERLLYERQVTDATVEVAPVAYCTLSAYTTEATCIAGGGVWKPGGTIRLKATADITTDVDATLRTVTSELDAMNGTLINTVGTVTAHGSTLTAQATELALLQDQILLATDSVYVDTKVNSIKDAADTATFASQQNIPEALAYLVLHGDDAAKKLRSAAANIAIAQFDIKSNADAVAAEATARLTLATRVGSNETAIQSEQTARSTSVSAVATDLTTLQTVVNNSTTGLPSKASTTDLSTANSTLLSAVATAIKQTSTTLNGKTATIEQMAESVDGIKSQWTIKTDVNGKVAGIGLMNDGVTADFEIIADRISFAPVATNPTAADGSPFFCLTAPTVVNGVTLPAGVYLKTAFIGDATIVSAQIKNLVADKLVVPGTATIWDAIIGLGKITNAYIDDIIQSTAYTPGSVGWFINKNGTVEFNGGTFRGAVQFTGPSSGYSNLSDRPTSLAGISTVDNNTLSTAYSNAGSAVTATNNWVKPGQTTIDGNKIHTGDAYVDTLQIKGRAVTVPAVSKTGSGMGTVATVTLGSEPVAVEALVTVSFRMSNGGNNNFGFQAVLTRGATTLYDTGIVYSFNMLGAAVGVYSFQCIDTQPADTSYTYSLTLSDHPGSGGNGGVTSSSVLITATGAKR